MAKEIVRITDLITDHENPVIENQEFEDKEIRGPAILMPLDGNCDFQECNFRGSQDAIFLELPKGKAQLGVIGIRSVSFVRCDISGIGLVATPPDDGGADGGEWRQTA